MKTKLITIGVFVGMCISNVCLAWSLPSLKQPKPFNKCVSNNQLVACTPKFWMFDNCSSKVTTCPLGSYCVDKKVLNDPNIKSAFCAKPVKQVINCVGDSQIETTVSFMTLKPSKAVFVENCPTDRPVCIEGTDGKGAFCGIIVDVDGDGVSDDEDNCPEIANPDQKDDDGNGVGNACQPVTIPQSGEFPQIVSMHSNGEIGNGLSVYADVSPDGRFVVFESSATNLVDNDANGKENDIFIRDREKNTTALISVSSADVQGDKASIHSAISANEQFVVFLSASSNLSVCTNPAWKILIRDRTTGTTECVGEFYSYYSRPDVSADGRFVVFEDGESNLERNIFVRDRIAGTTELSSVSSNEEKGNGDSLHSFISPDGRFVVFESSATNLVSGDTNGKSDVFIRDRIAGITERVSVNSNGEDGDFSSDGAAVSADGRFVVFGSSATNLVSGDTNGKSDVFIRDRIAGVTKRVSVNSNGEEGDSHSGSPDISANGRFIVFGSVATNLVSGDTNMTNDVFVHDTLTGAVKRVSVDSNGNEGDKSSWHPSISDDGRFIVFDSLASNLVKNGTNAAQNVFVTLNPLWSPAGSN